MPELVARAALEGDRVELGWRWPLSSRRPSLWLVRAPDAPPRTREAGLVVLDPSQLLDGSREQGGPALLEERRYVSTNSRQPGGLVQARLRVAWASPPREIDDPRGAAPRRLVTGALELVGEIWRADGAKTVRLTERDGCQVMIIEGLADGSGGERVRLQVSADGPIPLQAWTASGEPDARLLRVVEQEHVIEGEPGYTVPFHRCVTWRTRRTSPAPRAQATSLLLSYEVTQLPGSPQEAERRVREITLTERQEGGLWRGELAVVDLDVAPGQRWGYALFDARGERLATAIVSCPSERRLGERLYQQVPAGLRALDEPRLDDQGQGQLRRFLDVLGAGLDLVADGSADLKDLHDLERTPETRLAQLAQLLGWPLEPDALRYRLREAVELYGRLGTESGLVALLRRATGMDVSLRIYADRVLYSYARGHRAGLTLDTRDREAISRMGSDLDGVHYSAGGRYAANRLGVVLKAPLGREPPSQSELDRLGRLVAPFLPAHLRLVWILPSEAEPLHIPISLGGRVRLDEPALTENA